MSITIKCEDLDVNADVAGIVLDHVKQWFLNVEPNEVHNEVVIFGLKQSLDIQREYGLPNIPICVWGEDPGYGYSSYGYLTGDPNDPIMFDN